jgi:hypothetical protein
MKERRRPSEKIVAEAGRIDAAEDEIYGSKRGDELPGHVSSHNGRRQWLKQQRNASTPSAPQPRGWIASNDEPWRPIARNGV